MKKLALFGLFLASVTITSASNAVNNFYVKVDGGISIPTTKIGNNNLPLLPNSNFDKNGVYGLGVGYRFNDYVRTDINAQYREFNYKSTNSTDSVTNKTRNATAFLNFYLDGKNPTIFTPYLTGGIGYSRFDGGDATDVFTSGSSIFPGKSVNHVAWNFGAGSKIQITGNIDFDLTYRYVALGKIGFSNAGQPNPATAGQSVTLRNHEVTLGIAYNF